MSARAILLLAAVLALAADPVSAQGHGRGVGKGRGEAPSVTPSSGGISSPGGIRQFGSWLDDASLLEPRHGSVALSFGHYRTPGGRQTDFPVLDASYGLSRRLQIGVSVPFSRLTPVDGTGPSGLGDVYVSAKASLTDPAGAADGIGVAVQPLIEVLSQPDPVKGKRVFWALPVSIEFRRQGYRVYGSTGYFSRGAVFGSAAAEVPAVDRLSVTGALIVTHALNSDPAADVMGLSKTRVDVALGAVYSPTDALAGFVSIGRTISAADQNSESLILSAGVSCAFARRAPGPRAK